MVMRIIWVTYLTRSFPPMFNLYFVLKYTPSPRMAATLAFQKPSGKDQKHIAEMKGTELEESRKRHRKVTLFSCVIKVIS
jgi:hypothetical protein